MEGSNDLGNYTEQKTTEIWLSDSLNLLMPNREIRINSLTNVVHYETMT